MSKRAVHYDDWDGGTEADTDHPDTLMCGTEIEDPELTPYKDRVTCKRCLKIFADDKARIFAEDMQRKAELYDEVWELARSYRYANVTDAIMAAGPKVKP